MRKPKKRLVVFFTALLVILQLSFLWKRGFKVPAAQLDQPKETLPRISSNTGQLLKSAQVNVSLITTSTQIRNSSSLAKTHFSCHDTQAYMFAWYNTFARTGNQLFMYASSYCLAKTWGRPHAVDFRMLSGIFSNLKAHQLPVHFKEQYTIGVGPTGFYRPFTEEPPCGSIMLKGYFQSWKYFDSCADDLRKEFIFPEQINSVVNDKLVQLQKEFQLRLSKSQKTVNPGDITFVSIHIRIGSDIACPTCPKRAYMQPPNTYIFEAMDYFRKSLIKPLFLFIISTTAWLDQNFPSLPEDAAAVQWDRGGNPVVLDLALGASCNHSIITIGTFSWWIGWLTGGQVIYYKHFPMEGTGVAEEYNKTDYYPPRWIPM